MGTMRPVPATAGRAAVAGADGNRPVGKASDIARPWCDTVRASRSFRRPISASTAASNAAPHRDADGDLWIILSPRIVRSKVRPLRLARQRCTVLRSTETAAQIN